MTRRIETGKEMLIYGTAGFFDLSQAILALFTGGVAGLFQTLFGIIGYGTIWLMCATSGVSFFPAKKLEGALNKVKDISSKASKNSLLVFLILMGLELLPEIGSVVPSMTINAIMTVKASQAEDDAKDEGGSGSNPNIIRTKNDSSGGNVTPKQPGTIRGAKNKVS